MRYKASNQVVLIGKPKIATAEQKTPKFIDKYDVADLLNINACKIPSLVRKNMIPHLCLPTGDIVFILEDVIGWAKSFRVGHNS